MPAVAHLTRARVIVIALAISCGGDDGASSPAGSRLERAIDAELARRFGAGVRTQCLRVGPWCTARLPDRTGPPIELPIELRRLDGEWEWSVRGLVVATDEIESHLRLEVAELGAPQAVRCAPRIQRITPGDRIACDLEHGGKVFVTIAGDGATAFEIVLDPGAAVARSEELTPERERALSAISEALEPREGDATAAGDADADESADAGDAERGAARIERADSR